MRSMTLVAARELRNDTAGLVRRAQAGEDIVITVKGQPAAKLVAVPPRVRAWLSKTEFARRIEGRQADPEMKADLFDLGDESADVVGPI